MTPTATSTAMQQPATQAQAQHHEADTDAEDRPLPGDHELDEIFEQWSAWCRTRRRFLPPATGGHLLGKLSGKTRPTRQPPNAKCSAQMAALHLAILGQPRDALDTQVFLLYYGERVSHIKQAADILNISRQHFYRLRRNFGRRVMMAAKQIEAANIAAANELQHFAGPVSHEDD